MHRAITAHAIGDDHNVADVRRPVTANVAARTVYAAAIRPPRYDAGDVIGRVYRHTPCRVRPHRVRICPLPHPHDRALTSRWFVSGHSGGPYAVRHDGYVYQQASPAV